jgi:hypothetical protein
LGQGGNGGEDCLYGGGGEGGITYSSGPFSAGAGGGGGASYAEPQATGNGQVIISWH